MSRRSTKKRAVNSAVFSAYVRKSTQGKEAEVEEVPSEAAERFLKRIQAWYRQYVEEFRPARAESDDVAGTARYISLAQFLSNPRKSRIRFGEVPNSKPRRVQAIVSVDVPPRQGKGKGKSKSKKTTTTTQSGRENARFTGVTNRMRTALWADNDSRFMDIPARARDRSSFRGTCGCYGEKHGTRVHRQVQEIVTNYLSHQVDVSEYVHTLYANRQQSLDPCTITVFKILKAARLVPMACEFPIYDEALAVATQIDMVCVTDRGAGVFVELKTGYHGPFATAVEGDKNLSLRLPNMAIHDRAVLVPVKDTPFIRAVAQMVLMMIFAQIRSDYAPRKGCIIHISKDPSQASQLYELPAMFTTSPHAALARKLLYQKMAESTPKAARGRLKRGQLVANEAVPP